VIASGGGKERKEKESKSVLFCLISSPSRVFHIDAEKGGGGEKKRSIRKKKRGERQWVNAGGPSCSRKGKRGEEKKGVKKEGMPTTALIVRLSVCYNRDRGRMGEKEKKKVSFWGKKKPLQRGILRTWEILTFSLSPPPRRERERRIKGKATFPRQNPQL